MPVTAYRPGCPPVSLPLWEPCEVSLALHFAGFFSCPLKRTRFAHALAHQVESLFGQSLCFLLKLPVSFGSQFPQAGLAVSLAAHEASGFLKAAAEAQVVSDRVFPALWGRLKEWEVLPAERKGLS